MQRQPHRLTVLLGGVVLALAGWKGSLRAQDAHPAVVRVIAPDGGGTSLGSGALVAVSETHGLVVTNWHVIRDAAGPITVVFPDGFRSGATVMKADRDWDLAALATWRPNARPIPLAQSAPQFGEVLTIAGYGPGWYRATAGRCTQYVSPGSNLPFEMVELSTAARQGDSGGPILNGRGELAGVLFGSALGRTTGSYCGRVRWFLEEPLAMLDRLPPNPALIARRDPVERPPETVSIPAAASRSAARLAPEPLPADRGLAELPPREPPAWQPAEADSPSLLPARAWSAEGAAAAVPQTPAPLPLVSPARQEQIKTILAVIGLLAILLYGLRLLGAIVQK